MIPWPYQCKLQEKQCNYYSSKSSLPFFYHIRCLRTEKVPDGIRLSNISHLRHVWLVHLSTFHPPKENYLYIGFSYIGFNSTDSVYFSTGNTSDFRDVFVRCERLRLQACPYPRLAPCERKPEGDIKCLDIRSNGTTRLRRAQLVLTRILRIFDLIAKKHGIRYWLYRGTLLGAARHNGHVPFDNDIDVCIPKADYDKFVKYGVKELPEDIFFQTEETDRHWEILPFSGLLGKLRDTRSCYGCGSTCKHKNGLQLDMFVVEVDSSGNF